MGVPTFLGGHEAAGQEVVKRGVVAAGVCGAWGAAAVMERRVVRAGSRVRVRIFTRGERSR